ncbi:DNA-binding transcriptional LysR family regulator [Silvimonas terrae]|uniref:DNA-binding transcriptional LysR family regulator n=1 Tax=Silvimonas terrae TaxID=300266 RepID=A0A840RMG3_9NEIS|nr:LysR family transcriptional regulator [Silvimonas terrae]MBB5193382.1 DNA-binding transcriptional LysR family regulator [Silvimonas terrae]
MKLDGIATFVTVAECKSLSEAALKLRISRSVVSDRIVELEKELGTSLLQRTTRKITITEDGMEFLQRAIRIVREVEEATAVIAERHGTLAGPLRISAPVTFGRLHLGPALYPFLARHPEIGLTLDLNDRRVDAFSDGFDAIIRHGPIQDSWLVAWTLASSRRVLVAAPAYLAAHGQPTTAAELEGHRGIFYLNRGAGDWRFGPAGNTTIVHGQAGLVLNNGDMMRDAAVAGLGIALLPQFIASEALQRGELVSVDIGIEPEQEFIYIAHREGQRVSAKLRALADWLREAFGNPPYWDHSGDHSA